MHYYCRDQGTTVSNMTITRAVKWRTNGGGGRVVVQDGSIVVPALAFPLSLSLACPVTHFRSHVGLYKSCQQVGKTWKEMRGFMPTDQKTVNFQHAHTHACNRNLMIEITTRNIHHCLIFSIYNEHSYQYCKLCDSPCLHTEVLHGERRGVKSHFRRAINEKSAVSFPYIMKLT